MNAMTLQDILAMQAARQRAYEADLDDMVRYGKGALFTSTVIVDLYKMFDQKGENLMGLRLEIPTEVTLGQLVQLLGEVTQEQFSAMPFSWSSCSPISAALWQTNGRKRPRPWSISPPPNALTCSCARKGRLWMTTAGRSWPMAALDMCPCP